MFNQNMNINLEKDLIKADIELELDNKESEDILEKINRQIEFLKNRFEVTQEIDKEIKQDASQNDQSNNINYTPINNNINDQNSEMIKSIKEEK